MRDARGQRRRTTIAVVGVGLLAAGALLALPSAAVTEADTTEAAVPEMVRADAAIPTWKLRHYIKVGGERSFKLDLVDELPQPPQLVIFGGSRMQRFEPNLALDLTGLPAMNFALSNFRTEDAWAISNYLLTRSPDTRLRCVWGLQVGMFGDATFAPGLVYDQRLSPWFTPELLAEQAKLLGEVHPADLLVTNRYAGRGYLRSSNYDVRRAAGETLSASLVKWIARYVTARSAVTHVQSRSRSYFEATLGLLNQHGVTPCIVIMPYHPRALDALTNAGWRPRLTALKAYLQGLRATYHFDLLNYDTVAAFEGHTGYFYDGAHPTVENSRILLRHAVKAAPESFR